MIFVTVGTHEQQFNRLIQYMDDWAKENNEKVIIQTGYSDYEPKNCEWKNFYTSSKMNKLITDAEIIITHGGPSTIYEILFLNKKPIVVPRMREYGEHVNNHQVIFCNEFKNKNQNIIVINNILELSNTILNHKRKTNDILERHNKQFCNRLSSIIKETIE